MAPGEVTGRKPDTGNEPAPRPTPRMALSIREFCEAHGISVGMFFKMKEGLTPRELKCGARTLITFEAAADWRREREVASAAKPKVKPAAPSPAPSMKGHVKVKPVQRRRGTTA